ncbi:polysaccharide pyruvyl transferase family protein [Anaerospora hongkongensis]|uniref:polysaccharide pyruvyl transferase family protein n=1 Tax=Anaerospora hongkongensis TaxID=244830 RepID=UPI00289B11FB|nr:polysaccharide pyruvyl transferase family protein [Anaerospora hongkongensis]
MSMKKKRYAILGTNGSIANSFQKSTDYLYTSVGHNTGNLAFWYAVSNHVGGTKDHIGWYFDPDFVSENYSTAILPAANQIFIGFDSVVGQLADRLERLKIPLVVVGLGAQANSFTDNLKLTPGLRKFIKVISEKSHTIGVRGAFTAEILAKNGVHNVDVMGCPSNFINSNKNLGLMIEEKFKKGTYDKIALNIEFQNKFQTVLSVLMRYLESKNGTVICQGPKESLELCRGEFNNTEYINWLRSLFFSEKSGDETILFCKKYCSCFFNGDSWLEYIRGFDLSIGTRLHGNLLAWQAEVPSVFIYHDSRTQELIETMCLPRFGMNEIKMQNIEDLLHTITIEGRKYDRTRQELVKKYISIMQNGDVDISKELQDFCEVRDE